MTPERAKLLGELLTELSEDPKGFIPEEAWAAVQKAFALSYLEVPIIRRDHRGRLQILLSHRTDKDWDGWHVLGGLWRTRDTIQQGIDKIVRAEIGPDCKVFLLEKGDWDKWLDHPYGYPVVHLAICQGANIPESGTLRWFDGIPKEGMISDGGHHAKYIESVFAQTRRNHLL